MRCDVNKACLPEGIERGPGMIRYYLRCAEELRGKEGRDFVLDAQSLITDNPSVLTQVFLDEAKLILPRLLERDVGEAAVALIGEMVGLWRTPAQEAAFVRMHVPVVTKLAEGAHPKLAVRLAAQLGFAPHMDKGVMLSLTGALTLGLERLSAQQMQEMEWQIKAPAALSPPHRNLYRECLLTQGLACLPTLPPPIVQHLGKWILPAVAGMDEDGAVDYLGKGWSNVLRLQNMGHKPETIQCFVDGMVRLVGKDEGEKARTFATEGISAYQRMNEEVADIFLKTMVQVAGESETVSTVFRQEGLREAREMAICGNAGKARALGLAVGIVADPSWDRKTTRVWRELALVPPVLPSKKWAVLMTSLASGEPDAAVLGFGPINDHVFPRG